MGAAGFRRASHLVAGCTWRIYLFVPTVLKDWGLDGGYGGDTSK